MTSTKTSARYRRVEFARFRTKFVSTLKRAKYVLPNLLARKIEFAFQLPGLLPPDFEGV